MLYIRVGSAMTDINSRLYSSVVGRGECSKYSYVDDRTYTWPNVSFVRSVFIKLEEVLD
jgi:hypothetical protein